MAIGVTHRSDKFDTTAATSYATTTSFTPANGSLLLAWVANSKASAPDVPTFAGNGLTWTRLGSAIAFTSVAAPSKNLCLFYAVASGATAGVQTASFGGTETGCDIIVDEWTGVDTANPFVQNPTANTDAIQLSGSITFSALSSANNVITAGYSVNDNTGSITCAQTLLAQGSYATPATGIASGWATSGTTLQFTTGAVARWAMIGVELKAPSPSLLRPRTARLPSIRR